MTRRRVAPPSGAAPPVVAELPDGSRADLAALARTVCALHREEFPDEAETYGEVGNQWCVHDNQHILNWSIRAASGNVDLPEKLDWLARVLESRGYPTARLARDLELGADAVAAAHASGAGVVELMRFEAARIRATPTFL